MIILEGFDGSGKSSLAEVLDLPIIKLGPRPKNAWDMKNCLDFQQSCVGRPVVLDRSTAISTMMYGGNDFGWDLFNAYKLLKASPHVKIVYCRTDVSVMCKNQTAEKYETEETLEEIRRNAWPVVQRYDDFMRSASDFSFDYLRPGQVVRTLYEYARSLRNE